MTTNCSSAPARRDALQRAAHEAGVALTRIGHIDTEPGLRVLDAQGRPFAHGLRSFDHFAA